MVRSCSQFYVLSLTCEMPTLTFSSSSINLRAREFFIANLRTRTNLLHVSVLAPGMKYELRIYSATSLVRASTSGTINSSWNVCAHLSSRWKTSINPLFPRTMVLNLFDF